MKLIRLINDQKENLRFLLNTNKVIKRDCEDNFTTLVNSNLVKVLTGIRRCGKSVLGYQLLKGKKYAYLNFDDERLVAVTPDDIINAFYEMYGNNLHYIFFDEIQNLENWELFVNRLHRRRFNLLITGSNAKLLSMELATHLTGRHISLSLFPFSFKEYLSSKGFNENIETSKGVSLVKRELTNYLENGGFPEVIVEMENPKRYLRELYSAIVERDILNRHGLRFKRTFREMAMNLLGNPGRLISYNKLKKRFGLGSLHTIKNYIGYLEEAYIIQLLNKFSYKPSEIEASEKKVYIIDTGLINHVSLRFSDDLGFIYENAVAIELNRRKVLNPDLEIFYFKDYQDHEVDFVIKEGLDIKQLIQVCYDISDLNTRKRELTSLINASKQFNCNNLLVITADYEAVETVSWFGTTREIKFVPLWKWLSKE